MLLLIVPVLESTEVITVVASSFTKMEYVGLDRMGMSSLVSREVSGYLHFASETAGNLRVLGILERPISSREYRLDRLGVGFNEAYSGKLAQLLAGMLLSAKVGIAFQSMEVIACRARTLTE